MRNILIQDDVALVEQRLKKFEENTGCELLLVVTDSADPYPGASWRFGLIAGFLTSLMFSYYFEFHQSWMWPVSFLIICLFMTWVGHFSWAKRTALSEWEIARETNEKALELFHTLGTSKVSHKVTAMIMLSLLEKNIQLKIDEKLKSKISPQELNELIELMTSHFKAGNMGLGLTNCMVKLEEKILANFSGKVSESHSSELSDTIHFIRD